MQKDTIFGEDSNSKLTNRVRSWF